jgi:hypothetical protein
MLSIPALGTVCTFTYLEQYHSYEVEGWKIAFDGYICEVFEIWEGGKTPTDIRVRFELPRKQEFWVNRRELHIPTNRLTYSLGI